MTWYARDQWQSGSNVEAKLFMLARAFALGFRRSEFKTGANNERSRRALEALPAHPPPRTRRSGRLNEAELTRALVEASCAGGDPALRAAGVACAIRAFGRYCWVGLYDVGDEQIALHAASREVAG